MPVRDRLVGAGVVLLMLAILGATFGWRIIRDEPIDVASGPSSTEPARPGTTAAPDPNAWPVEIQPLVEFVEEHRGGPFDHPVPITYLERDQYEQEVRSQSEDVTPEDQVDMDQVEGLLQSLGLVGADLDIDEAFDDIYSGGTLAFYDPEQDEINVLGSDLDVAHRVTLVHELTHAWQDQHDFLDQMDDLPDTQATTLQALAEGDATRIEDEYVDDLSPSDREDYAEQSQQQAGQVDLGDVPDALVAAFSSPYALGAPYVKVLDHQGDNAEVDEAMASPPPAEADLIVIDRYLSGIDPVEVAEPAVPAGAERIDGGDFGATAWIMTLSERIDPRDALRLVDTWAGDQSVSYTQDGRVCTAAAYRGLTPADTDAAAGRIGEWAAAMPVGHSASVERTGDVAVLRSCALPPGVEEPIVGRSQLAMRYPALRTEIVWEVLAEGGTDLAQAECFAGAFVDQLSVEEMASGDFYGPGRVEELSAAAWGACPDGA